MVSLTHIPVLLREVFEVLNPKPGEMVLDVTVGLGGHALGLLEKIGSEGKFVGMDADAENLQYAASSTQYANNVRLIHANFRDLWKLQLGEFDIIFADLGLSSPHLDDPCRGFTYAVDAPLDMRYDRTAGRTAADVLNKASEVTLRDIFQNLGELRQAASIAKEIVKARRSSSLMRSTDLRGVIGRVYGKRAKYFLPQVFQALRIAVNDELGALQALLAECPKMLSPGGRMGVISYHSLEDRTVKRAFRGLCTPQKHPFTGASISEPAFELLTKKPVVPSEGEIAQNPRARSAKFRAIRKESKEAREPREG
jgi:16S rRNA (cytosine1402-N4)-methyltransferase